LLSGFGNLKIEISTRSIQVPVLRVEMFSTMQVDEKGGFSGEGEDKQGKFTAQGTVQNNQVLPLCRYKTCYEEFLLQRYLILCTILQKVRCCPV
jgi:hypothetical protein